jgi:hypothetical protein
MAICYGGDGSPCNAPAFPGECVLAIESDPSIPLAQLSGPVDPYANKLVGVWDGILNTDDIEFLVTEKENHNLIAHVTESDGDTGVPTTADILMTVEIAVVYNVFTRRIRGLKASKWSRATAFWEGVGITYILDDITLAYITDEGKDATYIVDDI